MRKFSLIALSLLSLVGCAKTNVQSDKKFLNDYEVLYIFFVSKIDKQDNHWFTNETLNWYKETDTYLIVDLKYDPQTRYYPLNNIAVWGIER